MYKRSLGSWEYDSNPLGLGSTLLLDTSDDGWNIMGHILIMRLYQYDTDKESNHENKINMVKSSHSVLQLLPYMYVPL